MFANVANIIILVKYFIEEYQYNFKTCAQILYFNYLANKLSFYLSKEEEPNLPIP